MGKRNQKKANGAGVYWVRAAVILLIIYVAKLTISYCSSVYYDREALYQGALNCSLQVLRKHGVDHWLQNGTLLGSTRLGRLVLWDADLDIGFVRSESNEKHGALLQDLDSVCFGPRSDFILGAKYPLKIYRKCNERICAEFYEALVKDGSVITSDGISSQRELFPLKNCTVANIIAQCPHNSSFYLKEAYGNEWLTASLLDLF
ncbi:unnamed protein product [Trypanosoma congolense IL3000]|uniref:WGS project CAEQ00000000 data, annotated contig 1655 n=1 Tax=Trypanosoma congolense (strain IL3000) TaxID=1068625 RepID=F9W7U5_TRYCI|nr:unnamed protein product [Trypanosoma congolense IL3000]CCD16676.1 unnamed protein product [Trypanosoma congolense IL3000]